jgi:hypothetical protein
MATHNLDLVRRADLRVMEINHGQLVFDSAESATAAGSPPASTA